MQVQLFSQQFIICHEMRELSSRLTKSGGEVTLLEAPPCYKIKMIFLLWKICILYFHEDESALFADIQINSRT